MSEINSSHFAVVARAVVVETTSGHLKMTLHAVLAALLCFTVAALCICCSHWSSRLAVPWLLHELFSGHMPGRLIIHKFLIPGSSQVQQMLLLPLLLNKVRSREKENCQYCLPVGIEINTACGIV